MTRDGEKVLVTGASSGTGAAVARALAARGHRVVAAGRRLERLEALAADSERIVPLWMNVTSPFSVRGAFDRLGGHDHGVDVLINRAGFAAEGSVEASSPPMSAVSLRPTCSGSSGSPARPCRACVVAVPDAS